MWWRCSPKLGLQFIRFPQQLGQLASNIPRSAEVIPARHGVLATPGVINHCGELDPRLAWRERVRVVLALLVVPRGILVVCSDKRGNVNSLVACSDMPLYAAVHFRSKRIGPLGGKRFPLVR